MLPTSTRLVTLQGRPGPDGPVASDFAVEEWPIPALQPGQVLLRNIVMSVDPSMRGRLETSEKQYTTNFEIGQPLDGSAIGVVLVVVSQGSPEGVQLIAAGVRDLGIGAMGIALLRRGGLGAGSGTG